MSVLIQGTQVPVTVDGLSSGNVSSTAGTSLELHALRARNYWWNVVQDTQFGSSDTGVSLVYDSVGNVYVYGLVNTPNGNGTLALKFNSEGYLQWRKSYTDANGFACGGNDGIAIDSMDNLYFMANDSVTNVWYAGTMDAEGNISPTYISLTGGRALDIAVDNSANMYFAGYVNEQGLVTKINSSTNALVWTTTLATSSDSFSAQTSAWAGSNVLVSGTYNGVGAYLLQLDSGSGSINWQQQISDFGNAESVSADSTGNAYVLVGDAGSGTAVYKVDVNGSSIWQTVLDGSGSHLTSGYDVVPDHAGHVYVLGTTQDGSTQYVALFISKLSADTGTMLWSHTIGYSFEDTAEAYYSGLRVGSVYEDRIGITGFISGPFPALAFTAQVPTDGSLVGRWDGPIGSATYSDVTPAWSANTYPQSYTFTTGTLTPHYNEGNLTAGTLDLTTLAIPAANVVSITTTIGTVADYESTITLTTDGQTTVPGDLNIGGTAPAGWISSMSNVSNTGSSHYSEFRYVMGDASGVYAMGDDFYDGDIPYMVKYDPNGAVLWQKQATYDGAEGVTGKIIQAQPYGADNLIVLGSGYNYGDGHEGAIVSLVSTVDGSAAYPLTMFSPSNFDLVSSSIAVGPGAPGTGNVYIAGYAATASYDNAWLVNLRDQSSAGYGSFTGNAVFKSVTTDATGNVYAGGQWYNGSSYEDIVIKTPSDLGTPIWGVSILPLYSDGRNGAVMVDDSTNSLFVTTYYVGHPRLSKLDAATGEGIWITEIVNVTGGSEGGVLTPGGDVIVSGWAQGPWNEYGSEGMLFSRVSGADGSVMWSNALYTTTTMGGGNYFWDNNSSTIGLIGDSHFGAGGWQTLDGAEGAMAVKLPLDGTGQGTYGPYIYASYAPVGVTTSLATTPRTVGITTTPVTFYGGGNLIAATVRTNQFELDLIGGSGQQGVGSINNILALNFETGGAISEQRHNNTTIMDINSTEHGSVSVNSWSGNGSQQAFSQLMWANAEITTQTYSGFQDHAYNWVYTDSAGFHVENHPNGFAAQGYTWRFDLTGNLVLPAGGTIGEGSAVIFGGSPVHTIELTPYGGGNPDQRLVIYPTAGDGNHLHLTSGNLLVTDIFLGDDTQFVKTNADGSMSIGTNVGQYGIGGNTWTFGSTGNLTIPGSINSANTIQVSVGTGQYVGIVNTVPPPGVDLHILKVADPNIGYQVKVGFPAVTTWGGYNTVVTEVTDGGTEWIITVAQNVSAGFSPGSSVTFGTPLEAWSFDSTGNFNLPGSGNIVNNSYQWQFGSDGSLTIPGGGVIYTDDGGINIGGYQSSFTDQVINLITNSGVNEYIWVLDNSGTFTVPGNMQAAEGNDLNIKVFNPNATGGVTFTVQNRQVDIGNDRTTQLEVAPQSIQLTTDFSGAQYNWTFGNSGNLTLPDGGYLDNNGGITRLGAAGDAGAQIGSADTQNYVTASNVGVTIQTLADSTNSNWTFGTDGTTTFPTGNLAIIPDDPAFGNAAVISSADHNLITASIGVNGGTTLVWVEDYAGIGTSNIAAVYSNPVPGSGIVRIAVGQNGGPGPKLWDFDQTGNLTLPTGGTINYSDGSNALVGGGSVAFNPTTLVQSVNITAAGNPGGGGTYRVTYNADSYTASVLSTGIVTVCQGTTQYTSGSAAVGSQTVDGTFGNPHADQPYIVYAHITTDAGTIWSAQASGTTGLCLIAGTVITMANGTTKRIEDISYDDHIRVWDFDTAGFATARALWIKRTETAEAYNELVFSDGSVLRTVDQHRIFNKQAGAFTYPMTDHTPLGTITHTVAGTEAVLVSKRTVTETVDYYNVITDRHINLFANGILTSCRFSNAYPIDNMRWVKAGRQLRDRAEFAGIADRWIDGLRLCEQTYAVDDIRWYVRRLESLEITELALAA